MLQFTSKRLELPRYDVKFSVSTSNIRTKVNRVNYSRLFFAVSCSSTTNYCTAAYLYTDPSHRLLELFRLLQFLEQFELENIGALFF